MSIAKIIFAIVCLTLIVYGSLTLFYTPSASATQTPDEWNNPTSATATAVGNNLQKVSIRATNLGTYSPSIITVKKGIPVEISFSADGGAGCGRQIVMRDFGINEIVSGNETKTFTINPTKTGTFEFACGMRMFVGQLMVVN